MTCARPTSTVSPALRSPFSIGSVVFAHFSFAPSRLPSPCSLARPVPHRVTRHLRATSIYKPGISSCLRIALSATTLFSYLSESPGVAPHRSRLFRTMGLGNLQTCKLSCFQSLAHSLSPKIEHRSFFSTTCALFCKIPGGGPA